jgi:O-antigen/teichoic acid export membrane protein
MIAVLFFTKNILLIILTYFLANTAFRLIFLVISFKKFVSNKKEDPGMVSYGKHLSLIKGISSIFGNLNNIFLFHFLGGAGLAVFSFAIAPIEQIRGLMSYGETLFMPKLSEESWKISKFNDFLKKALPFISIILAGTIIYIILAPIFYKYLFPKYLASIFFSRLLALTWIFTAINIIYSAILKGKRKIREQYIINAVDIGIGIFITLPMIYLFGIYGLVYSILINKVVDFLLMSILLFQKQSLQVE